MSKESDVLFLPKQDCTDALNQTLYPSPNQVISEQAFSKTLRTSQPELFAHLPIEGKPKRGPRFHRWFESWHGRMFRMTLSALSQQSELKDTKVKYNTWRQFRDESFLEFLALSGSNRSPQEIYILIEYPERSNTVVGSYGRILKACAPGLSGNLAEFVYRSPDASLAMKKVRGVLDVFIPIYKQRASNLARG